MTDDLMKQPRWRCHCLAEFPSHHYALLSPVIFSLVITGLIDLPGFTHIYFMLSSTVNKSLHVGSIEIWRQISLGKFGYSSALAVILY